MKKVIVIALLMGLSQPAVARDNTYVTVLGDRLVKPSTSHVPYLNKGYGLDGRYGVVVDERWSYEVGAFYDVFESAVDGTSGFHSGVGLDALFRFGELWTVTPFLIGGGGLAYSDLVSGTAKDPRAGTMFDLGAGVMTRPFAHLWGRPLSGRAQAKANYEHYDRSYLDVRVYAGLQLVLSSPAPAPVEEIAVVPAVEPAPAPVEETPPPLEPVVTAPVPESDQEPTIETAKAGDTIVLHGVNFETAKATLTMNAQTILDGVAEQLAKRPGLNIEIAGHTDSVGKLGYNQDLSERRAQSVLDYLAGKGVDATRLSAAGYGEVQPIDTNDTDEGRERNRRVELKIRAE